VETVVTIVSCGYCVRSLNDIHPAGLTILLPK